MKLLHFLSTLLLALTLQGCYYSHPNEPDHWAVTEEGMVDSVNFLISHHYWLQLPDRRLAVARHLAAHA